MIYLKNITQSQIVMIPKIGAESGNNGLKLTIKNTTDKSVVYEGDVENSGTSARFWTISVVLPDGLKDGEYEYRMIQSGKEIGSGLCVIGKYQRAGVQSDSLNITYKQYGN